MPVSPEYLHLVYPNETFRALLYGRNSRDPKKKGRSVADQLHEARGMCERFKWPIVDEFKDTGISASRHAKRTRDDFEELIEAIESGVARIVIAFEASRYYRDLEVYVRLRNACYANNVLLCYNGAVYDMSKSEDRNQTGQDALQAEREAEGIRDRNVRTMRLNAEAGKPHGKIPFGYMRKYDPDSGDLIGQFPNPKHAGYVDAAFRDFDSGCSVYSLVRRLSTDVAAARPDGAHWNERNVKRMLRNPAYIGMRIHQGTILRKAVWDPLLKNADGEADVELFRRVQKRLDDPSRGSQFDGQALYLLTGIGLCGECGDQATLRKGEQKGKNNYQCRDGYDTSLLMDLLDAYVEEAVLAYLSTPAAREALLPDEDASASEAQALLDALKQQLDEARTLAHTLDENRRPRLSVAALGAMEAGLQPQIDEAQAAVDRIAGVSPLVQRLVTAADPVAVWDGAAATDTVPAVPGLELEQKRAILRQVVTVRLYQARTKGTRKIEPGRIRLSFVGEPDFERKPLSGPEAVRRRAARKAAQGTR
ncbi:recombinase family protein [Streptomyces sp. NPDC058155]|uniref:recombinase family protein n=1 Tax=Streptomyces sp. NPDC058155 TaxID=3346359 RepID=UPI0036E3C45D